MNIKFVILFLVSINSFAGTCFSFDKKMMDYHKRSQHESWVGDIYDLHEAGDSFSGDFSGHGVCRFVHKGYRETLEDIITLMDRIPVSPIVTRAYLIKKGKQNYVQIPNAYFSTSGIRQVVSSTYVFNENACRANKEMDKADAKASFDKGMRTNSYLFRTNHHADGITIVKKSGVRGELHTLCYFPKN